MCRLTSVFRRLSRNTPSWLFVVVAMCGVWQVADLGAQATPDIRIQPTTLTYTTENNRHIYVELDWMETSGHSHKPSQQIIDAIVATFAREGFAITIDVSNAIPHVNTLAVTGAGPSTSPDIQAIKATHFNHAGDSRYFYSIWGHNYSYNGSFTSSSGIADLPGNTHLVTLGSFSGQTGTQSNQIGTFIHEFGHNINQFHGGVDHGNYKPNYLGVMNYHYQLDGIGPSLVALGFANATTGLNNFGYSHGLLPSLNEASLSEVTGIGLGKSVDWNCNGFIDTTPVARDVQASNFCSAFSTQSVLTDYDNWGAINAFVQTGAIPPALTGGSSEICATPEDNFALHEQIEALRAQGILPSEDEVIQGVVAAGAAAQGAAGKYFDVINDGSAVLNVTGITLDSPASWIMFEPKVFSVQPGGTQRVQVLVDFAARPAGDTGRRLLIASNDPDENPYPNAVFVNVQTQLPGAFSKTAPANGATGQPTSLTLTWGASSGATGYELCLDATPNTTCDGAWAVIGNVTSWPLSGLTPGATYSWHVRAVNGEGPTYAQASATAFWSFTVGAVTPPGAFSKTAPANGATGQPTSLTLTWGASSGASGYELCLDVTVNAACDGAWSAIGNVTSWPLNGLTPGVTYTWQVRALNAGGTTAANGGTWWTFVPGPAGPRSADFNSDGKPELVFQNAQGQVYAWFLNGLAFQSGAWLAQDTVGSDWKIVGTSDLSGDQKADLLWQHQTTGEVIMQTYDGTTRTGGHAIPIAANTPWRIMATGDFNGDGRADLVWQNATSGQVYVWFMTVTGGWMATFESGAYVTSGGNPVTLNPTARTQWRIAGAGDVNGDGQRDLVWRNTVTGAVTVWLLNGTTFTGSLDWGTVNLAWQLRAVGDYYGDATPDLVWQHTGTGEIYLWVRQGGALMPNTSVGTTSLAWQIVGAK